MTAIYGIIGESDASELALMGERLLHRGSHCREWSPAPRVRFGERNGADAPDSSGLLAFDGALDNAEELLATLGAPAQEPRTVHLRATVWETFKRYGPDGFGRLRGQFAVALWDDAGQRLVVARDRWGARALFYGASRERLVFASEYKALLALPDFPARMDRDAILFALRTHQTAPESSFLADATVVPRGSWLTIERGRVERRRFWDIAVDIAPRSRKEHATAVRTALLNALRRQMGGRCAVGLALSGGLDSALVLAGMRHVSPDTKIHTFTAGYGDDDGEIVRAREAATHFATQHHEVVVGPEVLPAAFPEAVWHMEEAAGGEEMTYQFLAARTAAQYVDTVFTGEKADAQFAGMPRHMLLKLAIALPPLRRSLEEFFHYTQRHTEAQSQMGKLLIKAYFRGDAKATVEVIGAQGMPPPRPINFVAREPLSERLRMDILDGSSKLGATFQLHAAHGLEWNSPFIDADLTNTAFEVPDNLKIHGLRQKYILRLACRGLVPDFILERKKSLQRLRTDTHLATTLEQLVDCYLGCSAVESRGIFRRSEVERARRRPVSGVFSREQVTLLWQLILTEIWARLFIDQRGSRPTQPRPPVAG